MTDPLDRPIHEGQPVARKHFLVGYSDTGYVKATFLDEAGNAQVLVYWQGTRSYKAHWPDDPTVVWRPGDGGNRA